MDMTNTFNGRPQSDSAEDTSACTCQVWGLAVQAALLEHVQKRRVPGMLAADGLMMFDACVFVYDSDVSHIGPIIKTRPGCISSTRLYPLANQKCVVSSKSK